MLDRKKSVNVGGNEKSRKKAVCRKGRQRQGRERAGRLDPTLGLVWQSRVFISRLVQLQLQPSQACRASMNLHVGQTPTIWFVLHCIQPLLSQRVNRRDDNIFTPIHLFTPFITYLPSISTNVQALVSRQPINSPNPSI